MRLIAICLMPGLGLGLAACDMGHLGNPLIWPVAVVGSGVENAHYGARRKQVSRHVAAHHAAMITDIVAGGGPALTIAADLAGISKQRRPELVASLQRDIAKFTPNAAKPRELLVVWLMVHGG